MKKRKFKYQQGGAPKVFNVQLPNNEIQPFAPLIQQASQPLETGFDAQRMFEMLKLHKLQEARLSQQNEYDKLRYENELQQQEILNQDRSLKHTALVHDSILGEYLLADEPHIQKVREKYGYDEKRTKFYANPGSTSARAEFIDATNKMARDENYIKSKRRAAALKQYELREKNEFASALKDEGLVDKKTGFLGNFNETSITPEYKPGYLENKKQKDALEIEKQQLDVRTSQLEVQKRKEALDLNDEIEKKTAPLWLKHGNATTPEEKSAILKEIEQIQIGMDPKGLLAGLRGTTAAGTKPYDPSTAWNDYVANSNFQEVAAYKHKYPNLSEPEIMAKIAADKTLAKRYAENPQDGRIDSGNWRDVYLNYNSGQISKDGFVKLTKKINNNPHIEGGVSKGGEEISYINGNGDKVVKEAGPSTGYSFVPSVSSSMLSGDKIIIDGTVYTTATGKDIQKMQKDGWTVVQTPPDESREGINIVKPTSDHVILSRQGNVKLSIPEGTTTQVNPGGIPTPKKFGNVSKDGNVHYLAQNGVALRSGDNDFNYSLRNNLIPEKAIAAIAELPKVLGDAVVPTGHWHHLRQPERDSTNGTKVINENINGRVEPMNFDISLDNYADKTSLDSMKALYARLVNNDAFKKYLSDNGYAVVLEGADPRSEYPSIDTLKKTPIMMSKLKGDAPHLSFEYIGKQDGNTWSGAIKK